MKARRRHPIGAKRPIHVFFDPIHKKFVATQYYAVAERGMVVLNGPKWDVTQDVVTAVHAHGLFGATNKSEAHEGEATSP